MNDTKDELGVVLKLPAKMNTAAAESLFRDIKTHRGNDLILDASDVQQLGGLCLQILISAEKTWIEDQKLLRFSQVSESLSTCLKRLGAPDSLSA